MEDVQYGVSHTRSLSLYVFYVCSLQYRGHGAIKTVGEMLLRGVEKVKTNAHGTTRSTQRGDKCGARGQGKARCTGAGFKYTHHSRVQM